MKYLVFDEDVYDDDILVFKKEYSYEVTYEDDNTYMCHNYGIDKSLLNFLYHTITVTPEEVS